MVERTMNTANTADLARMDEKEFFQRLAVEHRKLYAIAYSYLRSEADALEAVQEASCRAWMKRKQLKNEQAFTPWLLRITINCCMDELRRKKRVVPAEKLEDKESHEMRSSDRLDLERAMNRMKPKYRHVVMLKYYQDMTTPEIAKVLNKPEGTIKTWLREGLKLLRNYL
ncbi:sigma-70 family RNA polymerase sigma factor [Paenibacillus tritici]|jgi:RNA polymerase sigma factor (sigma-70 family)|uniref:Sigma-70 family RNA polymerase sigma factor n=1 Tax=Paenibacillus tritici TaxID=1873425 RepID=A0ABX2DVN3_9BACL|nr:sigma-70 family RNA polymerase sigma factor [Paenibacillus tritici]NQX48750.1 sigma-70 family RNA polymerase sigma factor [Paenibacillus tritici]QUL55501.1 sigma-70 family RNA polymerase sigma factor [Paenibacillus tritici]